MKKIKKEYIKGFKASLIVPLVLLVLFVALFFTAAFFFAQSSDSAVNNFGSLMQYHFNGFVDLLRVNLNNNENIIYYTLSHIFYGLIFLWLCFLVVGITLIRKSKRKVMIFGIVATFINLLIYIILVTGLPKYWLIINRLAPFEDNDSLSSSVLGLIVSGMLFGLAVLLTYFGCVLETYAHPVVKVKEEAPDQEEEQPVAEEEKQPEEEPEPIPEPVIKEVKEEQTMFEEEPEAPKEEHLSNKDLAELIRTIVKEEMSNRAPQGPLVVQYFGNAPYAQEMPKVEEKKEAPLPKEEPVAEVRPSDEVKVHENIVPEEEKAPEYIIVPEEKKEEPVEEAPVEESEEHKKIIRIPFQTRMINADEEMKKNYNELKNEIMSYGVNSRVSSSGDAFRLHRKTYVKITIAGLSLKLYFALNPDDYKDSTIPVQNAGHKGIYAEIPLVFKVKSGLSMRRAKELIQTVMEKDGFEQGPIEDIDWVERIKEAPLDTDESNEE